MDPTETADFYELIVDLTWLTSGRYLG